MIFFASTGRSCRFAGFMVSMTISLFLVGCAQKGVWPMEKPPITREIVGYSVRGEPLEMVTFGHGTEVILIMGGIHGNEPTSADISMRLIDYLYDAPELYRDRTIIILPAVNPDGLADNTRTNANQIDLNRNFPADNWKETARNSSFGGTDPASEPETQAIIEVIDRADPSRIVSIHSIRRGRHGNNFDGPARELAERMSEKNNYPVLETIGYPTPGSFGTWAGIDRNIPVITLELPRDLSGEECWEENREALLEFIMYGSPAPRQTRTDQKRPMNFIFSIGIRSQ